MRHVDALSRQILVINDNSLDRNLALGQEKDEQITKIREKLNNSEDKFFESLNGLVYRKMNDRALFFVPAVLENSILQKYHNEMGHVGLEKTIANIMNTYWFPNIREKVKNHIKGCLKCIAFSPNSGRLEGMLHEVPKDDKPFMTIHIDHLGPMSKNQSVKKRYILLVVDGFTKYIKLYATKSTGAAEAERMNRTIIPMIAKLADERNAHWYDVLEDVEFACNNTVNRSTGEAPSVLLYGVYQRGKVVDGVKDMLNPSGLASNVRSLETARDKAAKQIKKSFDQNKKNYDKKRKVAKKYEVGDRVMLRNFVNVSDSSKLLPQFKGPYEVAKVLRNDRYVIKDIDGFQVTQMPYKGTWAVWNMQPWLPQ
ncbi:Pro-Pol polyprotein [Anthophora plagiata]